MREAHAAAYGDIAQLVERCVRNAEVRGSSPLISTTVRLKSRKFQTGFFYSTGMKGSLLCAL